MEESSCGTCRYFVVSGDNNPIPRGQPGECRAHPPAAGKERWPIVHDKEWCGEWVEGSPRTADDIMPV